MDEVRQKVYGDADTAGDVQANQDFKIRDPTLFLPSHPPEICDDKDCKGCPNCPQLGKWYATFKDEVDHIVLRSNVHSCRVSSKGKSQDSNGRPNNAPKGCITADGTCAARFPRDLYEKTTIDPEDGHIDMRKQEPFINTFTPALTMIMRCNTDTTSLLSGTAVKAVISYVTDYITKQSLKTHQLFSTAYEVLQRRTLEPIDPDKPLSGARRTLLKIVNSLSTKLEIGSPMAAMYLLGHEDHYTSHKFVPFYWRTFVAQVRREATPQTSVNNDYPELNLNLDGDDDAQERVEIGQVEQKYFIRSNVSDYIHRPHKFERTNLYNWVQGSSKQSRSKADIKAFKFLLRHFDVPTGQHGLGDVDLDEIPEDLRDKSEQSRQLILQRYLNQAFHQDHPQFLSHYCSFNRQRLRAMVPNFLGGGLPRSDEGDREFYCSTMLTLFKPFRHGTEVIGANNNWDTTFTEHVFTGRELELMKNFNLRYECLDARDDHSAKRKAAR
ncbi:hypothetical protein GALMADRAFT_74037, partial [Galerina marginata CBS 339.88]